MEEMEGEEMGGGWGRAAVGHMGQPSLLSLQGEEPTSSTPPSAHTHTHTGQVKRLDSLTSCLSAQAIWSKSS